MFYSQYFDYTFPHSKSYFNTGLSVSIAKGLLVNTVLWYFQTPAELGVGEGNHSLQERQYLLWLWALCENPVSVAFIKEPGELAFECSHLQEGTRARQVPSVCVQEGILCFGHMRGLGSQGICQPLKCQPRLGRHRYHMAFWRKPDHSRKSVAVKCMRTGPNGVQQCDADSWVLRKVTGSSLRADGVLRGGSPAALQDSVRAHLWAFYASSVLGLMTTKGTRQSQHPQAELLTESHGYERFSTSSDITEPPMKADFPS